MTLEECSDPDLGEPDLPEEIDCPFCAVGFEISAQDEKTTCPICTREITRMHLDIMEIGLTSKDK